MVAAFPPFKLHSSNSHLSDLLLILFDDRASPLCDWMNISHPTHLPAPKKKKKKKNSPQGEGKFGGENLKNGN